MWISILNNILFWTIYVGHIFLTIMAHIFDQWIKRKKIKFNFGPRFLYEQKNLTNKKYNKN